MRVYTGQTRSRRAIARCERSGLGECTNRGELALRRTASGWFLVFVGGTVPEWLALATSAGSARLRGSSSRDGSPTAANRCGALDRLEAFGLTAGDAGGRRAA